MRLFRLPHLWPKPEVRIETLGPSDWRCEMTHLWPKPEVRIETPEPSMEIVDQWVTSGQNQRCGLKRIKEKFPSVRLWSPLAKTRGAD